MISTSQKSAPSDPQSGLSNSAGHTSARPDDTFPPLSDPWRDDATDNQSTRPQLKTPDPSLLDQTITASIVDTSQSPPSTENSSNTVPQDVLSEFDPLVVSAEEQAARNAWESAESHPPPPQTLSPPPPAPPAKDDSLLPSTSIPSGATDTSPPVAPTPSLQFPSLAALARTFQLPTFSPKARPQSLDVAKPVPSPSTLSSFAAQQDQSPRRSEDGRAPTPGGGGGGGGSSTPGRGSGAASPIALSASSGSSNGGGKPVEGQFDFQKFLDQMKTKTAEPVSKYLRSFLSNFAKRTFNVKEQIKIINDFLFFISGQMRNCDVWKTASEAEFDNAMEGMEKLVMNRLYEFTFTPQVARAVPPRPITSDDLEKDRVLSQRIALFGWLEEKHLDIPVGEGSRGFMMFAQQELLKINHYKAPRDKLICILNCCKVIFGLLRHLKKEEGADSFVPVLIYVVLKANPEHLLSNVEFISRFRSPTRLQSEAGYYLSSLMGAVSFIETMDHTSLSCITQEEFEANVERAIQNLPVSEPQSPEIPKAQLRSQLESNLSPHAGEESAQPLSISAPVQTLSEDAKRLIQKTGDTISKPLNAISRIFSEALDGAENKLSYLPGPFAPFELGREQQRGDLQGGGGLDGQQQQHRHQGSVSGVAPPQTPQSAGYESMPPVQTPYKPRIRRGASPSISPGYGGPPDDTPSRSVSGPYTHQALAMGPSQPHPPLQSPNYATTPNQTLMPPRVQSLANEGGGGAGNIFGGEISRTPTPNLDFAGVQAQIDTAHEQAAKAARDTLRQIFPSVDLEVVDWVLEAKEGDLGKSIEALLEMSSAT